jgi:hypothetical protein
MPPYGQGRGRDLPLCPQGLGHRPMSLHSLKPAALITEAILSPIIDSNPLGLVRVTGEGFSNELYGLLLLTRRNCLNQRH